jgi:D-2-hydroxyacid dehydrogenase (NADP+)
VRAVTRTGTGNTDLAERIQSVDKLDTAIGEADFVVLAAQETAATYHMIGPRQFAAMKASAYLINVSRGSLVDEPALIEALAAHKIAGAALDVAEEEPLPASSPLWKCENLLITPHLSAASEALWTRQTDLLLENLERWFSGRDLLNRVNLDRGY